MALLDDGDLEYMRGTQEEAQPTEATLVPQVASTPARDALGGVLEEPGDPDDTPVTIRIDNDPRVPEALATEHGIHLVRITAPEGVAIATGDLLRVSSTEEYKVVSHGDTDPWTTAQRLWAIRVVRGGA